MHKLRQLTRNTLIRLETALFDRRSVVVLIALGVAVVARHKSVVVLRIFDRRHHRTVGAYNRSVGLNYRAVLLGDATVNVYHVPRFQFRLRPVLCHHRQRLCLGAFVGVDYRKVGKTVVKQHIFRDDLFVT